ncbi:MULTISPECIES: ATP-binding cassette domain-containing protein [Polymorphospora]|uniref:ATP-binding cassette domain-containing protein n=1 Tax=Polymorphospora lycopeni TaxID=3140240 RepID=A0ABV5CXK8_9ACTN
MSTSVGGYSVSASGLTLRYGPVTALAGVSLGLRRGVTGLLGPNGAGKTTLLRTLATGLVPDSGDLTVLGHDPRTASGRLAIRRRVGYLPQNSGLHPNFTVFEFVDYVAILKEFDDRRRRHAEVRRVLATVGLDDQRGKKIKSLSGGTRQRVAVAMALVGDPDLLILDEPTVGLDPEQRLRFRELIAELGEGRAVLVSTHQIEDVLMLCQHVLVLERGQVRFEGRPAELAAVAAGRVWTSTSRTAGALASWRTATGRYRHIGDPPADAELAEPSVEDGYLLLVEQMSNGRAER